MIQIYVVGPSPLLDFDVENELEGWLLDISRKGAPINTETLLYSVQCICNERNVKTPFKENLPGRKWFESFMRRHPILSRKKAEHLSKQRDLITKNAVRSWFKSVRE